MRVWLEESSPDVEVPDGPVLEVDDGGRAKSVDEVGNDGRSDIG